MKAGCPATWPERKWMIRVALLSWFGTRFCGCGSDLERLDHVLNSYRTEFDVPHLLVRSVLCLEDRRFFRHPGFDVLSIFRAFLVNLSGEHGGGASTIEQQFVRTVTNRRERTLRRKGREILLAAIVSDKYGKLNVLKAYLNIAYFGHGISGYKDAAKLVLNKEASLISRYEGAILASLLLYPQPKKASTFWLTKVRRRARYALSVEDRLRQRQASLFAPNVPAPILSSRVKLNR